MLRRLENDVEHLVGMSFTKVTILSPDFLSNLNAQNVMVYFTHSEGFLLVWF